MSAGDLFGMLAALALLVAPLGWIAWLARRKSASPAARAKGEA
jgi:hypothetical protein